MDPPARKIGDPPEPRAALRELAGRISTLPFSDMMTFAQHIADRISGAEPTRHTVADILVEVARALKSA